jgi:ribosomal-protein-alanine N-acetyltransferase
MPTVNFTPFPAMATERLVLRQLSLADLDDVYTLRANPSVSKYIARDHYTDKEEARGFINKINTSISNNETGYWAIALKTNNRLIGTCCLWHISKENSRAEIGYELHPDFQGKGIMREALGMLLNYCFKTVELHSLEAVVDPKNIRSIQLLEKYGFVREAYFKENTFFSGKFMDTAIYSLLSKNFLK